jgi:SnoaL-like domain
MGTSQGSVEDRLRAVEDKLAIYQLIASHPPAADSGNDRYYLDAFTPDGVMDLGYGKSIDGSDAIAAVVRTPEHKAAIAGGLCHFSGLPRVEIDGDKAIAISYLQIVTPNRDAPPVAVSGHGTSSGFRIHRCGVNLWELVRTPDGWKVKRRTLRLLEGSPEARDLLTQAV